MIEFTFVRWKNFISYGDSWTEVPLNGNKATLVVGDNGAGKSTVIDALCYSLYGKLIQLIPITWKLSVSLKLVSLTIRYVGD